ncbi:MAG: ABC transporter substrate-binding protein [Chloroflexi bacterium]|nr:ABC transporter substrate-binding protein [Chloroflexota bacterium]
MSAAPSSPTPGLASVQPKRGGILRTSIQSEPPSWDEHVSTGPSGVVWEFVGQSLLREDPRTRDLLPGLARSWEWKDDRTLVLRLHQGVRFHNRAPVNGRGFTADDVVFSVNRIRTPSPKFARRGQFDLVDKVRAVDPYTVEISLKQPFAPFLDYLSWERNTMVPRETVEKADEIKDPLLAMGTGPFMVKEYVPGVGGNLTRNPDFWMPGKPYLDGVSWVVIVDDATRLAAYRTARLDYGTESLGGINHAEKLDLERTNPQVGFVGVPLAYPVELVMDLKKAPFNDVRFRKAIDLAVNRQETVKVAVDGGGHVSGPLSSRLLPQWALPEEDLLKRPGFRLPKDKDVAEAKRLLTEAGIPPGYTLLADATREYPWLQLAPLEAAKSQLDKIGVNLEIRMMDFATYKDTEARHQFAFRSRGFLAFDEPDDQLRTRYYSKGARNYGDINDPELDAIIDKQRATLDTAERKRLVLRAQGIILDRVYQVHLFTSQSWAIIQPWVKGLWPTSRNRFGLVEQGWLDR